MLSLGFTLRVRGRRWRVAAVVFLLGSIVFLSGIRSWPDQIGGMRPGNKTDEFYRYVAQQLNEPVLSPATPRTTESCCWDSSRNRRTNDRSATISLPGRTRNPWLCWKVKRLGAFSVLSNQTSMWTCLDHAVHGRNGGIAIAAADLVRLFAQMGYDPDSLHLEGITPPSSAYKTSTGSSRPNPTSPRESST